MGKDGGTWGDPSQRRHLEQSHKQGENVVCEKLQELLLGYNLGYS